MHSQSIFGHCSSPILSNGGSFYYVASRCKSDFRTKIATWKKIAIRKRPNCGKGEGCQLKKCSACKMVQYCSVDCQKAHRPQHKRECKKRAAEIFDKDLFKQPPQKEDCPICFLT